MDRPLPTRPASPTFCAIPACPLPVTTGEGNGQGQHKKKEHNRTKLSVGEPDLEVKQKLPRRTQSVLDHGMKITTLSNTAARIRKNLEKTRLPRKVEEAAKENSCSEALALGSATAQVVGTAATS